MVAITREKIRDFACPSLVHLADGPVSIHLEEAAVAVLTDLRYQEGVR